MAALSIEGSNEICCYYSSCGSNYYFGVPIFDTTFAIFRRLLNGKSIAEADKGHLHHRLLKMGYSQKKTVLILYSISAVFGICATLIAKTNSKRGVIMAIVLFIITLLLAGKMGLITAKEDDHEQN